MPYVVSAFFGYLLGCFNPADMIAKRKKKDIRKLGTGNPGTTNVVMNFGKRYGAAVLFLDVIKAYIAVKLIEIIYPLHAAARLLSGFAAILGHVFPFYMKFRGGKGLASFLGLLLAYDPLMLVILLICGALLAFVVNYSCMLPLSAAGVFPLLVAMKEENLTSFLIAAAISIVIIFRHSENIMKAYNRKDTRVRDYLKKYVFSRRKGE